MKNATSLVRAAGIVLLGTVIPGGVVALSCSPTEEFHRDGVSVTGSGGSTKDAGVDARDGASDRTDGAVDRTDAITGSGGKVGSGGVTGSGGKLGSGGVLGSGGRLGSGGAGTGGAPGSGGTPGSGGASGSGGAVGSGGSPSDGGVCASGTLVAQYKCGKTGDSSNELKPVLNLVNRGTALVELSKVTIRYWYTLEPAGAVEPDGSIHCDYAASGCPTYTLVAMSASRPGADKYLEVSFAAGKTLGAGAQTGEMQARWNTVGWNLYTQSNDYSYSATMAAFADWNRVGVYQDGVLVWGCEP